MSLPRFFVAADLGEDQRLNLPKDVAHHLQNVLRLQPGDELTVFNGRGGEYRAVLVGGSKKQVEIKLGEFNPDNRSSNLTVHLGLCVLKKDAMDRAIARCVELGISKLTPLISERCTVSHKIIKDRHKHWQQVIITACEQCGLNLPPELNAPQTFQEWTSEVSAEAKIMAAPDGEKLPTTKNPQSIALVTGPEGGFSEPELNHAISSGFDSVKLGERILRGENAPGIVLAVMHQQWGDFL